MLPIMIPKLNIPDLLTLRVLYAEKVHFYFQKDLRSQKRSRVLNQNHS